MRVPACLPKFGDHGGNGLGENFGVASAVVRDVNSVTFGRSWAQINRVAEVTSRNSDSIETKPWLSIKHVFFIQCSERADGLLLAVSKVLSSDECAVAVKLTQCCWYWPLQVVLVELPVRLKYPFLVRVSVCGDLFGGERCP